MRKSNEAQDQGKEHDERSLRLAKAEGQGNDSSLLHVCHNPVISGMRSE